MGEFAVILINISKLLPCVEDKKKHIRIVKKFHLLFFYSILLNHLPYLLSFNYIIMICDKIKNKTLLQQPFNNL